MRKKRKKEISEKARIKKDRKQKERRKKKTIKVLALPLISQLQPKL
jgi:hypothetical protein